MFYLFSLFWVAFTYYTLLIICETQWTAVICMKSDMQIKFFLIDWSHIYALAVFLCVDLHVFSKMSALVQNVINWF